MQERQRLLYVTHPCIPALHIRLCQVIRGVLHCRCQQKGNWQHQGRLSRAASARWQLTVFALSVGGHVVSAVVGCAFRLALKDALWIAAPVSMAVALLAMQLTRTVHPPGAQHQSFTPSSKQPCSCNDVPQQTLIINRPCHLHCPCVTTEQRFVTKDN